ncbi:ShlB/FhaC/HecB family hemolysin secretion/activation protein [Vogesella sp. LYT5W]|uniref:ShlB/FhaC/HecB family hemolysin secretion/activation protein n=1 Tax=Vogesella margarita TaxID=2984199 RepID=A0ABT5IM59_9NEIS|nr:ShlB/FhaC/HecB family hemolysin secretion/activation protein [Vogesella margarita]MDC7713640.1 ShlB/FhaC/HecB family hemolysin secretion/activation protein [Vogesella margarita]
MKHAVLSLLILLATVDLASANELAFDVAGYQLDGRNPLNDEAVRETLQPFTGKQQTVASLQQAAAALQARLAASGHRFYRVILPPQTLTDTVSLKLVMMPLGSVSYSGQNYFSREQLAASFPVLQPGLTPDTRELARNLAQFNDHPAHEAVLTLSESRVREAIDVTVQVEDRPPSSFWSSLQNTGNDATGRWRLGAGWHTSALAGTDQQLTVSYTTSPDQHHRDVAQFGLSWKWPLYRWATDVSAYAVHSDVDSGTVGGFFDVSGRGDYAGVALAKHLLPLGQLKHGVKLGLDYKAYGNKVMFDQANLGADVTTTPLTLGWFGVWQGKGSRLALALDWSHNLPGGNDNDDAHHLANRHGADANWQAWRGSIDYQLPLSAGWSVLSRLQAQYSRRPLVPGEQFGIGGSQSVRGYEEREAFGDQGHSVALEAWTPLLASGLRAVLFADSGSTRRLQPQAQEISHQHLLGLGAGLRWQPNRQYGVSIDLARPMTDTPNSQAGTWRAHVLATARF